MNMKRVIDHQSTIKGIHYRIVSYYFADGTFQGSEVEVSQKGCGKKVIHSSISRQSAIDYYKQAITEQIEADLNNQ